MGKVEEQTERFFRMATKLVVEAVLKNSVSGETTSMKDQMPTRGKFLNYGVIDAYANLVSLLIRRIIGGGSTDQIATQRFFVVEQSYWDHCSNNDFRL